MTIRTTQSISWTQQCDDCEGTGIYVGLGEKEGAGVVCSTCKGTAFLEKLVEYEPFTGRKMRDDVDRVYAHNPGFVLAAHLSKGGMRYWDWRNFPEKINEVGRELREHVCPAWWYNRAEQPGMEPKWDECVKPGSQFTQCSRFSMKNLCWDRFDIEHPKDDKPI